MNKLTRLRNAAALPFLAAAAFSTAGREDLAGYYSCSGGNVIYDGCLDWTEEDCQEDCETALLDDCEAKCDLWCGTPYHGSDSGYLEECAPSPPSSFYAGVAYCNCTC